MKKLLIFSLLLVTLSGCSAIKVSPQGEQVSFNLNAPALPPECKNLGSVEGYGQGEEEAFFDLRHNAYTSFKANTVVVTKISRFYQTQRMRNYIRSPELKYSMGKLKHEYNNGFDIKAEGNTFNCPKIELTD